MRNQFSFSILLEGTLEEELVEIIERLEGLMKETYSVLTENPNFVKGGQFRQPKHLSVGVNVNHNEPTYN